MNSDSDWHGSDPAEDSALATSDSCLSDDIDVFPVEEKDDAEHLSDVGAAAGEGAASCVADDIGLCAAEVPEEQQSLPPPAPTSLGCHAGTMRTSLAVASKASPDAHKRLDAGCHRTLKYPPTYDGAFPDVVMHRTDRQTCRIDRINRTNKYGQTEHADRRGRQKRQTEGATEADRRGRQKGQACIPFVGIVLMFLHEV
jgi:hypothetical protein